MAFKLCVYRRLYFFTLQTSQRAHRPVLSLSRPALHCPPVSPCPAGPPDIRAGVSLLPRTCVAHGPPFMTTYDPTPTLRDKARIQTMRTNRETHSPLFLKNTSNYNLTNGGWERRRVAAHASSVNPFLAMGVTSYVVGMESSTPT